MHWTDPATTANIAFGPPLHHRYRDLRVTHEDPDPRLGPLIFDLVEWVAREPRSYAEVMDAWRTSCPRLAVWEEAVDRGLLARELASTGGVVVRVTPCGRRLLEAGIGAL